MAALKTRTEGRSVTARETLFSEGKPIGILRSDLRTGRAVFAPNNDRDMRFCKVANQTFASTDKARAAALLAAQKRNAE